MPGCGPKEGASVLSPALYFSLGLIQAFEAVQGTIMFSIMPFIVAEFYRKSDAVITEQELEFKVGQGAGILSASFFLAAFFSSFIWGWASDRIGRRPVLLLGTAGSIMATVFFAISDTLMYALAARCVVGLLNGNLAVLKTYLGEVTTSENQASAFANISAVSAATAIVSPLAGGILGGMAPGMPFAFLPGIISASFGTIVLGLCFIFLPETSTFLERRNRNSIELAAVAVDKSAEPKPSRGSVILLLIRDRTIMLSIVTYSTVCILHISVITMLPMFFRAHRSAGGLGMPSRQVGALFAVEGVAICLFQMFVYPRLARRFGIISLLKRSSIALSLSLLVPLFCLYTTDLIHFGGHWVTTVPLMLVIGLPTMACFTCTNLLVNNSASDDVRGAVNGLAHAMGCMSRCLGPIAIGTLWSFSTLLEAPYMSFVVLFITSFALCWLAALAPSHLLYPRSAAKANPNSPKDIRMD